MYRTPLMIVVCGLLLTMAQTAAAQTSAWEDHGYINANFAVQSSTTDLTGGKTFSIYDETGAVVSSSSFGGSTMFDVGAGVRVWRNLSVGVAYNQGTTTADATLTGTVPNPLFFNQPRTFSSTAPGLERKEQATHLQFGWMLPLGDKMDLMMFAGPTFFRVQQDTVSDIKVTETSPFTTVTVTPVTETAKKSATGYNVGADFSYMLWSNDSVRIGAGAFVRYAKATSDVPVFATTVSAKAGGIQFGFGGKLRF